MSRMVPQMRNHRATAVPTWRPRTRLAHAPRPRDEWLYTARARRGLNEALNAQRSRSRPRVRNEAPPVGSSHRAARPPRRARGLAGADPRRLGLAARRGVLPGTADVLLGG